MGKLLDEVDKRGLTNLRVYREDALAVLEQCLPEASLTTLQLFFPDPWPKKKHHKRRIVQPAFVELIRTRLMPGGTFHMATDWEAYAEWMADVMEAARLRQHRRSRHGTLCTAPRLPPAHQVRSARREARPRRMGLDLPSGSLTFDWQRATRGPASAATNLPKRPTHQKESRSRGAAKDRD